jgi:hypothetical protein
MIKEEKLELMVINIVKFQAIESYEKLIKRTISSHCTKNS